MRLVAFSDWRARDLEDALTFVRNLREPPDLILYAGDDIGRFYEKGQNYFNGLASYASLGKVLAVAGNDDLPWPQYQALEDSGAHNLHKEPFVVGDFAFIGLEGSTSGPGFLMHSEKEVKNHLEQQYSVVSGKKIIVLSHSPPYEILDLGRRFAPADQGAHHIGSKALRDFISKYGIFLIVCGHSHIEGGRLEKFHNTTIVNVASHDVPANAEGRFVLIDIEKTDHPQVEFHTTSEYVDRGSIRNLYRTNSREMSALENAGIKTLTDLLAVDDLAELSKKVSLSEMRLRRLHLNAKALIENRVFRITPISIRTENSLFFDIETDIAQERVWLIGTLKNNVFKSFYADDWSQEKRILEQFLEYIEELNRPTLISYSGTSFDTNVISRALTRHGINNEVFSHIPSIDLCQVIRSGFMLPIQRLRVKQVGQHFGFQFRHPDMDGLLVALRYHRHLEGSPLDPRVFEYNEDDVRVLPYIIDQLFNERHKIETEHSYLSRQRSTRDLLPEEIQELEEMYELRNKGYNLRELVHILRKDPYYIYDRLTLKPTFFSEEETVFMIREFYESPHGRKQIRRDKRSNGLNVTLSFRGKKLEGLYTLRNAMASLGFCEAPTPYLKKGKSCEIAYHGKMQMLMFMEKIKPQTKNDIGILAGERVLINFDHARRDSGLPLRKKAITEGERKDMLALIQRYPEEYKALEQELSRVPLTDWGELFERYQAGTVCLTCFRNGYDWKNTIRDPVAKEIICGTCGEVLKSPSG